MASARLGQSSTRDTVSMRFDASSILYVVDKYTGYFRSGAVYGALSRANDQAAIKVQEGMVEVLNRQIGHRDQRPGKRLEMSLLDERNREVYANTFSVGISRWMDRSPAAAYYRAIDEGQPSYEAYVSFSDGPGTGPAKGPFFRPMSGGGLNMRMPHSKSGPAKGRTLVEVGPFPEFHYTRGARTTIDAIDMAERYRAALATVGIKITKDNKSDYFK